VEKETVDEGGGTRNATLGKTQARKRGGTCEGERRLIKCDRRGGKTKTKKNTEERRLTKYEEEGGR